jgi:hypothetical protein
MDSYIHIFADPTAVGGTTCERADKGWASPIADLRRVLTSPYPAMSYMGLLRIYTWADDAAKPLLTTLNPAANTSLLADKPLIRRPLASNNRQRAAFANCSHCGDPRQISCTRYLRYAAVTATTSTKLRLQRLRVFASWQVCQERTSRGKVERSNA